ncbi:MAG: hypothetical protein WAW37_02450 [Syntrophobacteraceae bacterium]
MNAYLTAILPVLGVVIGASLQFWFSRATTNWSRLQDRRIQAYVDFLKGVAGTAVAQRFSDKKSEIDSLALLADARARICVYGHSEVITALASFSRETDSMLSSPTACRAFTGLIQVMRKVSNSDLVPVGEDELFLVLFRSGPNK